VGQERYRLTIKYLVSLSAEEMFLPKNVIDEMPPGQLPSNVNSLHLLYIIHCHIHERDKLSYDPNSFPFFFREMIDMASAFIEDAEFTRKCTKKKSHKYCTFDH
jgi:hypothetical protein